ncbi:Ig-like domain-containing protein [Thermodesulfobacteriota bacterium B35]
MFLQRCFQWLVFFLLCLGTLPPSLLAARVDFSWLPNTEPNLAGYRIHYGISSGNYTDVIDVGLPPVADGRVHAGIDDLTPGQTYYFAATAYDSSGIESDYSTEISTTVPETTPPPSSGQAEFSWLPNTEPNLAGYRIHYGTASRAYTTTVDVGLPQPVDGRIHATVTGLIPGETYFFAATAYDASGGESDYSTEVSYTVPPASATPPVAADGSASGPEDSAITGQLEVSNSSGLPLQYAVQTGPASGTLSIEDATGRFTYTPLPDFSGSDSFTFTASNSNGESNPASIAITVTPVNDIPVALDTSIATSEDTAFTGQLTATDPDGDTLTFTLATSPAGGSVTISPAGAFTYTPAANANGTDTFSFAVSDGSASATAAVSVTINPVNDPPTAHGTAITLDEDTTFTGQLTATDPDGDTLTFTLATGPAGGSVTISPAGAFTYTPAANANGDDTFSFAVSDGSASATATVSVTINPVNDPPTAHGTAITLDEDTTFSGQLTATDPDGDPLTFTLATSPAGGSVTISPAGAFTYTPAADANGDDSFSFAVSDGTASATATVSVTINPVNDPPTAHGTAITVDQGATVSGTLSASDSDGDPLNFNLATGPGKGSVSLADDGSFTYQADSDATGSDTFSFTVSDGHAQSPPATVTVTISEVTATLRFETGELQVTSAWQPVAFDAPFRQPVVIARATGLSDPDPGVIRVRNVTSTGFEVRFQEWDSLDGDHGAETVTYMAMEQGSFSLDNGTMIEAGCFPATAVGTFAPVAFVKPMQQVPVVMTAIDTVNESDAVTTRLRNITALGFEIMMQEQEANPAAHAAETGCYIAWEPSAGTMGDMLYEVTASGDEITHNPANMTYSVQFPRPPLLLAEMESTDGADTAVLRVTANSVTGATLMIQEERSRDAEQYHTTERGGMIALCAIDPAADPDGDGLTTAEETETYHTHPGLADTDGDTMDDGREVSYWQEQGSAWDADLDGDGLINLLDGDADGDGISDGTEVAEGTDPGDPASAPAFPAMDAGELTLNHNWVHVDLATSFTRPVVVARLVTRNGGDPSVLRIANVSATGFDIRLQEYDYLDGTHTSEQVDYLVMEAGHYTLADGTQIEAGIFDSQATGVPGRQTFSSPFARVPVVVTAIVSDNEADAVTGRLRNIDLEGFDFRLQEQEANPQVHATESVAYIAWEPSATTIAGIRFAVGRSTNSVTSGVSTIAYAADFARPPLLITDMQTTDGGDTASLRTTGRTADAMQVMVEEERSRDSETSHTTEVAGYIAILTQ